MEDNKIIESRYASHIEDAKHYTTERLRSEYLIEKIFITEQIKMTYSHFDRIIVGGAYPKNEKLTLEAGKEIAVNYFSKRNEVIVLLDTDKGIQGIGESACFGGPPTSTNLKHDNLKYC